MEFSTTAIHHGQSTDAATGAVSAPIYQTSTFEQDAPGRNRGYDYARTNNPTRARVEGVLAALEHGHHAALFGSGLAAEHAILQAYLRPGDGVVVPLDVYGGTYRLLHRVFEPLGCTVTPVDFSDLAAVGAAVTAGPRLVWLESPTNPRLQVYDIGAVCRAAHDAGALVVVDNTFATPYFQRPLDLGADLVVHSVTKYLAGHSDVIQGAVVARDHAVFEPVKFLQNALGAVPGPFDCWLTLRGLKTLELRMDRHAATAQALADLLQAHPRVARVHYPGLPTHPGHEIARRQMTGFGGMLAFELDGTADDAQRFAGSRRFFALAESLGGVRALVSLPGLMTHASIPAEARRARGITDTLIRLSPGIESTRDLLADIRDGLDALAGGRLPAVAGASGTTGAGAAPTGPGARIPSA
jgi:cystathionine beta-lyase/cystathionine gamma-synthase